MPQESVFVHHNTAVLFSGEHLQYKVYCLNNNTRKFSDISQIAYVTLLDKGGTPVFTHKIRLKSGTGYGDFFVPTEVTTGSYKLIGYTDWMKNNSNEDFFQTDVRVINPYQPISEDYLPEPKDSSEVVGNTAYARPEATKLERVDSDFIELTLTNDVFGYRQQGKLEIKAKNESALHGMYSLSIRKIDSFGVERKSGAEIFFADFLKKSGKKPNINPQSTFLPELRGEIITGTVVAKESGAVAENQKISLSLPGKDYLFQIARTNSKGRFYFTIDEAYDNEKGVLQLLSDDWDSYEISMDGHGDSFKDLVFEEFTVSEDLKNAIMKRSVQNQIENAYVSVKSDSLIPAKHPVPLYRNFNAVYQLDEYTRFNSLQETIIEIVDQVSTKKLDNGERIFQVRPEEGFSDSGLLPLVFVDGLFLKRHEDFMDYSAKKIKSIRFSRDKYLIGSEMFQGMLLFETIEGGFVDTFYAPHLKGVELFKPQAAKDYFVQSYDEGMDADRIPDFRSQLLWMPNIKMTLEESTIDFYTSDLAGDFEIVLEGFTKVGRPVSLRRTFRVE